MEDFIESASYDENDIEDFEEYLSEENKKISLNKEITT